MSNKEINEDLAVALYEIEEIKTDLKEHSGRLENIAKKLEDRLDKLESKNTFIAGIIAGVSFLWLIITQAIPWVASIIQKKIGG